MRRSRSFVVGAILLAFVVPGGRGGPRADEIATTSLPMALPRLATLAIAGDVSGLLTLTQDGTGEGAFDAGAVESAADAIVLTINANDSWELSVKRDAAWTDPAGYDKSESDLLVRISNTPTGTIQNGADSYFSPGPTDTQILNHGSAVANNEVEIQTEVLLDWEKDVPGTYAIEMTYTLVVHLP